jgi:hypothetical protein
MFLHPSDILRLLDGICTINLLYTENVMKITVVSKYAKEYLTSTMKPTLDKEITQGNTCFSNR